MEINDTTATFQELKNLISQVTQERDWTQFHSPKNVAVDISIEAAELLEKFIWMKEEDSFQAVEKNRQEIEDEAADVLYGILAFANAAKIDISSAFIRKLEEIKAKYPIEKAKGVYTKYNKL
ncbi:MAG: nucleotide pyrophosphohydrolase [Candidatus Dependentiae bacterium]|nr:nucleotide pyrophosphohydrolase [Candidatus Dependentiae bacterium]